jgi:hypothetical protein
MLPKSSTGEQKTPSREADPGRSGGLPPERIRVKKTSSFKKRSKSFSSKTAKPVLGVGVWGDLLHGLVMESGALGMT